jgi:ABC-type multidrug transport system permease subunit
MLPIGIMPVLWAAKRRQEEEARKPHAPLPDNYFDYLDSPHYKARRARIAKRNRIFSIIFPLAILALFILFICFVFLSKSTP